MNKFNKIISGALGEIFIELICCELLLITLSDQQKDFDWQNTKHQYYFRDSEKQWNTKFSRKYLLFEM